MLMKLGIKQVTTTTAELTIECENDQELSDYIDTVNAKNPQTIEEYDLLISNKFNIPAIKAVSSKSICQSETYDGVRDV